MIPPPTRVPLGPAVVAAVVALGGLSALDRAATPADAPRMRHPLAAAALLFIACENDPAPAKPGSAQEGDACQSEVPAAEQLCAADLVCYDVGATEFRGYCAPACEAAEDCAPVDGWPRDCFQGACVVQCDGPGEPCPESYAVPLYCFGSYCARDTESETSAAR